MTKFADKKTRDTIGITAMLGRLATRTAGGAASAADPRCFGPADHDAWEQERAYLQAVDDWLWPPHDTPVLDALAQLPSLDRASLLLDDAETLDDVALFELKRFAYWAHVVLEHAPVVDRPTWRAALLDLMATIHPEATPTPRFALLAALDPELADAREAVKAAQRDERQLRRAVEATIAAAYGGNFDVEGLFHATSAIHDARLIAVRENVYRIETSDLTTKSTALRVAQDACAREEQRVRSELTRRLTPLLGLLHEVRDALYALDFAIARVQLRRAWGGCWAQWSDRCELEDALHPALRDQPRTQPISIAFDEPGVAITGPNMGGKSMLVKLLGVAQWCGQHAFPIPAHACTLRPIESLTYIGADLGPQDDDGLSAFGREVHRVVEQRNLGRRTLWLLDELGRGTHPAEGAALALDFVRSCIDAGDHVIVATHFPTLATASFLGQFQIAGLRHEEVRAAVEAGVSPGALRDILTRVIDYQPLRRAPSDNAIPRDARLIAAMLGLDLS